MKTISCSSFPFLINAKSLDIDGIDLKDYPDFCDAFFCYGEREDGTPLTDEELETLTCEESETLHSMVFDQIH
jgi:hypothetical protein